VAAFHIPFPLKITFSKICCHVSSIRTPAVPCPADVHPLISFFSEAISFPILLFSRSAMTLHQFDYLFVIGTIFAFLDAWNIGRFHHRSTLCHRQQVIKPVKSMD
jgi:hypothetical protein